MLAAAASLSLAAVVTESATPPGCVVRLGLFLSSALTTPSASCLLTALSVTSFPVAPCVFNSQKTNTPPNNSDSNCTLNFLFLKTVNINRVMKQFYPPPEIISLKRVNN